MYPKPAKEHLIISPSRTGSAVNLNIYNQQRQKVLSKQISVATTSVSISNLPVGVYLAQLMADGISETHKLIRE